MEKKRLTDIEKRIKVLKKELSAIGEMRPGSLTQQYKDRKNKTGGFYQLSYTHKMKSRTEYVRAAEVENVRKWTDEYKKFKQLVEEWSDLAIEHSRIKMGKI